MNASGIKKLLVAVDGSEESMSTVNYVAKMMPPTETEAVLFHVFSRIPETYWDFDQHPESDVWMNKLKSEEKEHEKSVKAFMKNARQLLLDANFREQLVSTEIKDRGKGIARDIAAEAKKGYHTLVMGRIGTGQLPGLAVGSVTNKVLGMLPTMTVCVVTGDPESGKVLVALDGSEGSMRALNYLCSMKNSSSRKVILFHAMRHIGFSRSKPLSKVEKMVWEDARKMIEPFMAEAKERLVKAGFAESKISLKILTGVDSRAGALIDTAKKSKCGTIMVGRTGISQVEEFNIGRVSTKVIHKAKNMAVWVIA
jgi:nucleotide-binding universal stress UspA family protein